MCPPAGSTHRCSPTLGDFTMRYRYEISKFLISSESPNTIKQHNSINCTLITIRYRINATLIAPKQSISYKSHRFLTWGSCFITSLHSQ